MSRCWSCKADAAEADLTHMAGIGWSCADVKACRARMADRNGEPDKSTIARLTAERDDARRVAEVREVVIGELHAERDEARAEVGRVFGKTWPPRDVVARLADFADYMLRERDYDGHGWEELQRCRDEARAWLAIGEKGGST